jgi:hypothetical protein
MTSPVILGLGLAAGGERAADAGGGGADSPELFMILTL